MAADILFPNISLPLRDSLRDLFEESRSRIPMESGPPRMRRQFRTAPRIYELVWDLSQDEFLIFDEWFQYVIMGGDRPFDIQVQDDLGDVAWLTVRGLGEYAAECINGFDWLVKWRVRSIESLFYNRVPVPMGGAGRISVLGTGNLKVLKPVRGIASIGVVRGRAYISPPPISAKGRAGIKSGKGRLYPRPIWGVAIIGVTPVGRLVDLGEPVLTLPFNAIVYSPPLGGAVTLQFDDVIYIPPAVG